MEKKERQETINEISSATSGRAEKQLRAVVNERTDRIEALEQSVKELTLKCDGLEAKCYDLLSVCEGYKGVFEKIISRIDWLESSEAKAALLSIKEQLKN